METKTHEQQQIAAQKETIESLTQTVERLEKELQKCLDPGKDAGEYKLQAPGTHTNSGLVKDNRLDQRIYMVITACFLPTDYYSQERKEFGKNYQAWWYFRSLLFEQKGLFPSDYWNDTFRDGVEMLNDIVQVCEDNCTTLAEFDKFELGHRLFGGAGERGQDLHNGMKELISALLIIRDECPNNKEISSTIDIEEINDMLGALTIVEACQKIYLDAGPEPGIDEEKK